MTKFNEAQLAYLEKLIKFHSDDPDKGFDIRGNVLGNVGGSVEGHVEGSVEGNIGGDVFGDVEGDIDGKTYVLKAKGQDDD